MATDYLQMTADVSKQTAVLRKDIPDTMSGFSALAGAACKAGALDAKTKEYIALGIAVALRCEPCIAFHAKALVKLGVTKAEYEEVLGVAVYMDGGPGLMYAAHALEAFEQFSAG
ncbi:carboxymuconolactone decarboxylase family protein [Martelella sp. AD-3]|uniref:carboxymuconolactone decarboxylase family protein n=1 Tax=Martelella sp. AD-3 TaxID=686597 RepID=UPI0004B60ECE|nr:carboxymuconolactone decarboxylase family protein [Martelella sp. AD-3]AMM85025.1 alkylhydroperoxidase [Martelella sp. AD-3]MAM09029.1 carboxymuconolactone decarboxylase family protein [Rhizobiaceae bacterium]|tara:strand:+ start:376 stop:720 length:345 start_codon:yes stop_codon:yes gene_type:complete